MPDETFDYDEFVNREFGKKRVLPHGINWFWWMVGIVLAILFTAGIIGLR